MRPTKLKKALAKVEPFFEASEGVYRYAQLAKVIDSHRDEWGLPTTPSARKIINQLIEESQLKKAILTSDTYKEMVRYIWNDPSPFLVAQSLKEGSYLSHGSAVFLHGLNEQIPKTIYVNKEQSVKPTSDVSLIQESIDRTFSNKQRESKYIYAYKDYRITILSGKNTNALEVSDILGPSGERLRVTKVQRTLIDSAVRPTYAGGVFQVLDAYRGAMGRVSVASVMATLKQLGYAYPYHQAIGFYMSRAGWPADQVAKIKKIGLNFDFYLDYGTPVSQRAYDKEWRLFYPKGL